MRRLNPPTIHPPFANYAHGVEIDPGARYVFCSGQLGVAPDGVLDRDRLDSVAQKRARLAAGGRVTREHDDRNAERAEDGGVEARFAMRPAVESQFRDGHTGDGMRVNGLVGFRHGVIADEDGGVERTTVGAFQLAVVARVGGAGHQVRGRMQVLEEDIAHRAMAVGHQDIVCPGALGTLDGRVGVARHQAPAAVVLALVGAHHVTVYDAGDALHVDRDVDVHELATFQNDALAGTGPIDDLLPPGAERPE